MTFLQIKHFLSLAHSGSFAKASKVLYISQPALSRSIKALEDELGQLLFDRIGRRIEITSFGAATLKRAQEIITALDELKISGKTTSAQANGKYRLGLSSGPGALLSTQLLSQVANAYPKVKLEIFRANTHSLVDLLKQKRVDAIVVDLRSLNLDSELNIESSYEFQGEFLCRKGHPLLKLKRINFDQLLEYPIASTPLSDELTRILVARFGNQAHPSEMIGLLSDEIHDLVSVAKTSNTVMLAARAAATDLQILKTTPALNASAKYALISMKRRSQAVLHTHMSKLIDDIFKSFY